MPERENYPGSQSSWGRLAISFLAPQLTPHYHQSAAWDLGDLGKVPTMFANVQKYAPQNVQTSPLSEEKDFLLDPSKTRESPLHFLSNKSRFFRSVLFYGRVADGLECLTAVRNVNGSRRAFGP